jgi:hypothetical protein
MTEEPAKKTARFRRVPGPDCPFAGGSSPAEVRSGPAAPPERWPRSGLLPPGTLGLPKPIVNFLPGRMASPTTS